MFTVNVLQFRGDRIARESIYVMEGFEAPDWRAPWATRFDPLASVAPVDWHNGAPFGIEASERPDEPG